MRKSVSAALFCAILAPLALGATKTPAPSPSPKASRPPEIYHTTVRPVCSVLRSKIQPAVGMLIQNDQMIAKAKPYFKDFNTARFNESKPSEDMSIMHMQNVVLPLANNVLAIQKLLEDPNAFPARAQNDDDVRALKMKDQLMQTLAHQQAALDIINGFVETQQLGDMQHEGFGYIAQITAHDTTTHGAASAIGNVVTTPNPMHPDPFDNTVINAGLPTNPYELDLTRIPGLALGYNPVSSLEEGVTYTQTEGGKREGDLAKTVVETVKLCGGHDPAALEGPSRTPLAA